LLPKYDRIIGKCGRVTLQSQCPKLGLFGGRRRRNRLGRRRETCPRRAPSRGARLAETDRRSTARGRRGTWFKSGAAQPSPRPILAAVSGTLGGRSALLRRTTSAKHVHDSQEQHFVALPDAEGQHDAVATRAL